MTEVKLAPEIETINRALLYLSDNDQDHASEENGVGFSGRDTQFGNSLANQLRMGRTLTPRQASSALRMLKIYSKQLAGAGIYLPAKLPDDIIAVQPKDPRSDGVRVRLIDDILWVRSPWNQARVDRFKQIRAATHSPGFDPISKEWRFNLLALSDLISYGLQVHPAIIARYEELKIGGKLPTVTPVSQVQRPQTTEIRAPKVTRVVDEELLRKATAYMDSLERKPYAHQREFVLEAIKADGRSICAMDVGTGKTFASLITAKMYSDKHSAEIWVIAPISLHDNWRREAESMHLKIRTISWAKIPPPPDYPFVLIADEAAAIQHMKTTYVKDENGKPVIGKDGKQLKKITPIRTAATLDLALSPQCKMFLALTGTPVPNGKPAGLYPMLKCCKHWLSLDKRAYEVTFCDAKATRWSKWDVNGKPGEKTLLKLYELTRDIMYRKRKTECLDLPPLTRVMKPIEMSTAAARDYNDALDRLRSDWQERVTKGEISGNNEALVTLSHLLHATSIAKIESTIQLVNDLVSNQNQVLVVFAFKDSLDAVERGLDLTPGVITGDTPGPKRQPIVDEFQAGKIKSVLFTHSAGGVGLNLQRGDMIVFHDRPWTCGMVEQCEGRSWRSGRTNPVVSIWEQANDTDRMVDAVLQAKHENTSLIVDGRHSEGFSLNITIDGKSTILPDFNESIGEIAVDLVRTILGIRHSPLDSHESDDTDAVDDEENDLPI